ncbi:SRPBCC family protein [Mucilaginibacter sp.]|uniref:SRPBCC family protein n=1 Tax=Mucilaginibacter sp. TaxID=1882438 RepID=UPI003D12AD56
MSRCALASGSWLNQTSILIAYSQTNSMTTFESNVTINQPISKVYSFLADFNNHQKLMPDSIVDWVSTADTAKFNIQNMAKLSLKIESRIENTEIVIIPAEKPPFDMELKWSLSAKNDSTEVLFTIAADLNLMLKMMASGPLQKLANHQTQSLYLLVI